MDEKKIVKFNLYMTFVLLTLMIAMLVGTTIAYFTARKQSDAVFVSGNVEIALSEAAVKREGYNLVADPDKPRIFGGSGETPINNYGSVYPGQFIYKDPTVTNKGDNEEWIAVKVTFTDGKGDLTKVMGYDGSDEISIKTLVSGGLLSEKTHVGTWKGIDDVHYNDNYAMVQVADASSGTYEFYFFVLAPLAVNDSVTIFDSINIPAEWNNADMQNLVNLGIKIQAYGVQTTSLDSCLEAMVGAFPTHFNFQLNNGSEEK